MPRPRKLAARFGSAYTLPRLERALNRLGVRVVPWQQWLLAGAMRRRSTEVIAATPRTMLAAARLIERLPR